MFDYRSLAERRLGLGLTVKLGRSYAWKNLHPIVPAVADHAAESTRAADSGEAVTDRHELSQLESEFRVAVADPPAHLEAAVEPRKPGFTRPPWADRDAAPKDHPRKRKSGTPACPVCGRRRSRIRFSSVGGRLMSRCLRCDLLTIVNPLDEQYPAAHAEHLRYSMKTFWFHLRGQLKELGHRGPVGYSGPAEYSGPIAQAARDLALIVPLEDLERYTDPGKCPAILLFHTLECVPDPDNLLAKCYRMLAADGRLFVAASDAKSLQCLLRPSKWSGLQLKTQLFCYSSSTLSRLFRAAGFRVSRRLKSGLEVLGMSLEDAFESPSNKESGFKGFLKRWFQVISWLSNDFGSCGSVLYLEAVPNKSR